MDGDYTQTYYRGDVLDAAQCFLQIRGIVARGLSVQSSEDGLICLWSFIHLNEI